MAVFKFDKVEQISKMLNIEIIEYGLFCGNDWKYTDLKAPYARLYILLEGEAVILIDEVKTSLKQGNAYVIPSNLNFSCYTPTHMKKLYVHFSCKQWADTNLFDQVHEVLEKGVDTQLYEPFISMLESDNIMDYWFVKGGLIQLIYQFIGDLDSIVLDEINHQRSPELMALYKILKRGISAKTRTKNIADEMKMSQSMLSKLYKSATGMSLKHHIQLQLMEQAQMLLIFTNKSIKEIAGELHYEDSLYFTRIFHQMVGEAPSRYRAKNSMSIVSKAEGVT